MLNKINKSNLENSISPIVSIIIPTYNRANLMGKSISSVLDQIFKDFEVIIVDDGSVDNTESVVKSFNDTRIKYVKLKKNRGSCFARNVGLKIAEGEYIAFQDSDDEWLPEKLEKQMKVFEILPQENIVYTGFWRIKNNKKTYVPFNRVKQREGNVFKELLRGNFISTQTLLVKKKCFEKSGMFDENLPRFQDWDLVLRLAKYYNFKFINEPLALCYFTSKSISTDSNALLKAFKIIEKKYLKNLDNKLLAKHYFRIGNSLCLDKKFKLGRNYFIKSIRFNFLNFSLIAFLFSFLGQKYYDSFMDIFFRVENKCRSTINKNL